MSVELHCEPCGHVLIGTDEDELVNVTQEHARTEHDTELTREQVLAMAG